MHHAFSLYRSSVGKKILMALSGVILFAFVVLHMLGNLKLFSGEEGFDNYALFLRPERDQRAIDMVTVHDDEGFGSCTNHGACQVACPQGISVDYIARLNRDLLRATLRTACQAEESGNGAA